MLAYAKTRHMDLSGLRDYATYRHQKVSAENEGISADMAQVLADYQVIEAAYEQLQADFQVAKKLKDVALQKTIAASLLSTASRLKRFAEILEPFEDRIQKADKDVKYWQHILDLIAQP
jgi:hypothetical protein